MNIGAQLYTVRDYCRNLKGLEEALERIADIGYKYVQLSGVCGYEADWMRQKLDENGLKCVLTHFDPERIRNDTHEAIRFHNGFDCRYIGIGSIPGGLSDPENYLRFVNDYKLPSEQIKQQGGMLLYHNHQIEFMKDDSGKLFIDKFYEDLPYMGFTADVYWIQYAGGDPAYWIERLAGRVPCIHLKDMACVGGEQRMAPVGEGNINFDAVFGASEKSGVQYMLVEQDDCCGENPFECLKRSYLRLKSQGFN